MKKIVKTFVVLTLINITFSSCKENSMNIAIDKNLLQKNNSSESMITAAENKLGKLFKTEKKFTDNKSGSTITLEFASIDEAKIKEFFLNNTIYFEGFDLNGKNKIMGQSSINAKDKISNTTKIENEEDYFKTDQVYYDLKSVKLSGKDVGYGFSVIPKSKNSKNLNSKNLRPNSLNWCQQTSLKWCEMATIFMKTETTPKDIIMYAQTRGWVWTLGFSTTTMTNGGQWTYNVDCCKFTRFGGENVVEYIDHITWYDWETGDSRNNE